MEYKIFGAAQSPSDDFVTQLQTFCELDEVQREALAVWFESTSDFNIYTPEFPTNISASTLLPDQFRKAAAPIRYILSAWQGHSLEIGDIERDLLLLGLNSEQLQMTSNMLQRLSPVKMRVWLDEQVGTAQVTGLPTIDDANIIWDARAVFGGPSYHYFSDESNGGIYKQCFGLTCMAILELMVSDTSGTKERFSVQMDDTTFQRFRRAVNHADEQLQSLRALIEPMKVGLQSSEG